MELSDVILGSACTIILAFALYVGMRIVIASGEMSSCYVQDTSPGRGAEFKRYSLMANVDWRPDYEISGGYTSLNDARAAAAEIGCNLK